MDKTLRDRREAVQRTWAARVSEGRPSGSPRADVLSSWRRSARAVSPDLSAAPVAPPEDVVRRWEQSPLGRASRVILDDLTDLAADGDMMAAVTDETVTIAWAVGGRTMTRRADRVHFTRGACWDEAAVGTNALCLARHTSRPATVFSAEHFAPMVHDWVCYSAPVNDPRTGRFLGVIDLSTAWTRAHPALITTVGALARCVEHELASMGPADGPPVIVEAGSSLRTGSSPPSGPSPRSSSRRGSSRTGSSPGDARDRAPIGLTTLGPPALTLGGTPVPVTRRQLELLTVLSLHPDGLNLDELTGRVYGDQSVSRSTVKAELSHLRTVLGDRIASRPYRLVGPVDADHRRLLDALAAGDVATAVDCYRGPLLVASDGPEIEAWRHHIDVAVRDAALATRQPDLLYALSEHCPDDPGLQAAALAALAGDDARHCLVAGRLAAAGGQPRGA